jgi:HupE / UreJ protein
MPGFGPAAVGLLLLMLAQLLAAPAAAHKPSDSYLRLNAGAEGTLSGQWDIALRDLEHAIGLDADGDGAITWGELRAQHAAIAAYALARLKVRRGDADCAATPTEQLVDDHSDGAYAVLRFTLLCPPASATSLDIEYRLFADLDPLHRGLLALTSGDGTRSAVLDPGAGTQRFDLAAPDRWRQFGDYLREGVWHIWIGFDHILFLLSLLLPSVLAWQAASRRWAPVASMRGALVDVVTVVTAFTLAHSITLTLATLGVVSLPSALVESTIAASVVLAALNNVWPVLHRGRWAMAFGFGLIHGFGFASVLADLGLPQGTLLLALVAFNVGVELGQLAIVAVFLPLAYALRSTRFYRRALLVGGSAVIAVLAAWWFTERAFGIALPGPFSS